MKVELLAITPDAEAVIEQAGRVCYRSESKAVCDCNKHWADTSHAPICALVLKRRAFIQARLKDAHESIVEHASATFQISGISRACSHQLVRHRLASYSQESQRYVKLGPEAEWVVPPSVAESPERLRAFQSAMCTAGAAYDQLLELGCKPEDARMVLPNATPTVIVMSTNFREWRHFLRMRLDKHAQWEIRNLAMVIGYTLWNLAPACFDDVTGGKL